MNDYIIHDYIDNRSDLIDYLNSKKFNNAHFLASDVQDGHLANFEFINNAILVASNSITNLSGKTYNFGGLLRRVLSNLRIHSFFCKNTKNGLFKSINSKECDFFKKETFDFLSENPNLIKDNTNLFFEINSGVNMNTEVAFRNHDHDLNILNINLLNMYKNHETCSSLKIDKLFVKYLKGFFNGNIKELPKMDDKYLSLCNLQNHDLLSQVPEVPEVQESDKIPEAINGDKAKEIWKNVRDVLYTQETSYRHWLSGTDAYDYNYQDQVFMVTCETDFCKEMIETRIKFDIEKLLSNQLDKKMELQVL